MAEEKKGPSLLLIIGILLFGGSIIQIAKTFLLAILANFKDLVWSLTAELKGGTIQGIAQLGLYAIFTVLVVAGIVMAFRALRSLF